MLDEGIGGRHWESSGDASEEYRRAAPDGGYHAHEGALPGLSGSDNGNGQARLAFPHQRADIWFLHYLWDAWEIFRAGAAAHGRGCSNP